MNKSSKRWKVFVIVLCMLFTMTPGSVFADDLGDPTIVDQMLTTDGNPQDPGTPPEGGNPQDTGTPPEGGNPQDTGTPPEGGNPPDTVSPPAIPDPGTPLDPASPPAITDPVSPPAVETLNMVPMGILYTNLIISKDVKSKPNYIPDEEFTFDIYKWSVIGFFKWDWVHFKTVTITGENNSEPIPVSWDCFKITERPNINYTVSKNDKEIDIEWFGNHYVSFKNTYTGPTTGGITITKNVSGAGIIPETVFDFTVTGPDNYSETVSVTGGAFKSLDDLEPGDYTVTESEAENFCPAGNDYDQNVEVKAGLTSPVEFTNIYNVAETTTGSITIVKEIEGDEPSNTATFNFKIVNETYTSQKYVTGATSVTAIDIPVGTYTVTEDPYPDYTTRVNNQTVTVAAGENKTVTFINDYDDPNIDEPAAYVTKKVAEFNGAMPPDSSFVPELKLYKLNKEVIYKIDLWCNSAWSQAEKLAYLQDIYNGTDITDALQIFDGSVFKLAKDEVSMYPYMYLNYESHETYFYKVTLPANGTYTNTAYLYETEPQYRTLVDEGDGELEQGAIASSSAVVVVEYSSGGGGGGGGGSRTYYEVTYNANLPAGADLSGSVPTDSKNYSYNTTVSVKGNTDGLKAGTYTFEGWNTKPDGTGTMYLPGNTFNIKEDTLLYAQWKLVGEPVADDPVTDSSAAVSAETADLDDVPKTGDTTPLIPMLLLGLLSLAAITLSRKKILD